MFYLDDSMQRSLSNSSHQLVGVGDLAFIGFPLLYFIWVYWLSQPYEGVGLRIVGSLLGLTFYKLVMNRFSGDIICDAVEGEYSLFNLNFPVAEH